MTNEQLKQAIDFAKKNPDDPRAKALRERIESGQLNFELKSAGLKTFPVKTPKIDLAKTMAKTVQTPDVATEMPGVSRKEETKEDISQMQSAIQETKAQGVAEFGKDGRIAQRVERGEITPLRGTLQRAGGALQTAGEIGFEAALGTAKVLAPKNWEAKVAEVSQATGEQVVDYAKRFKEELSTSPNVNDQQVNDQLNTLITKYETDETFRDDVNAAGGFVELLSVLPLTKMAGEGIDTALDLTKQGSRLTDDVLRQTAPRVADVTQETAERAAGVVGSQFDRAFTTTKQQADDQIEEAVKRIVQAKSPDDIAAAKEALKQVAINPEDIKSYQDLKGTLKGHIEATADAVDNELGQYPTRYNPSQVAKYEKVGDATVATTPVQDAMDGLQIAYTKSGEAAKAEAIRQLRQKFDTEGLTVLEMNQLAREYGIEFKDRAFDKMGNVKSGYNAENFENVRSGLKDVVRERIPDEYAKELDAKLSNLYTTDKLVGDIRDKVFQRANKMPPDTFGAKVAGVAVSVADFVDMLTLRITSNIFQQLVRKSRLAQKQFLNPIELEAELQKNLQTISKLMDIEDTPTFQKRFQDYINSMQIGMSIKPIHTEDSDFFMKLSDPKYTMTDQDMKIAKETLAQYGLLQPVNKTEMKSYLQELTQQNFDETMDASLKNPYRTQSE